jgi:hypothetical protein
LVTLQAAIDRLYTVAVSGGSSQSTLRLGTLGDFCVEQLAARGLSEAEKEVTLPGGGRPKTWDVAWKHDAKYRLAISLKSILANLSGTVPNRTDDLMGEVTNVQMYSPEVVVGYVMIFDVSKDVHARKHESTWCDLLRSRLTRLSGRSAPSWSIGMIEAFSILQVDFSTGPRLLTPEEDIQAMFDVLAEEVKKRNPSLT